MSRRVRDPKIATALPLSRQRTSGWAADDLFARSLGRVTWMLPSGDAVLATAFRPMSCPAPANCSYLLVAHPIGGHRAVLAAGRTLSPVATQNLARLRYLAANLGADEIHLIEGPLGSDLGGWIAGLADAKPAEWRRPRTVRSDRG